MKKILLIGCGHMGSALLTSWIKSKKYSLTVIDPFKYKDLKKKYNNKIKILKKISNLSKSINYDFVVFATKPIDLNKILDEFSNYKFLNQTVIVSVIAGKKINLFEKKI